MTTRWRPDFDPSHLYFITTTAVNRVHIFKRDIIKRIIVDSLYYTGLINRVDLYAFVVMPNHIHVIIQCPPERPPQDWARAFKNGAARLIIRHYQVEENQTVLNKLAAFVTRPKKQHYKVWEDGYLPKSVASPGFLRQKLTYLHNNPLQSHWRLAPTPEAYPWSSARYYLRDKPAIIPVKDARQLLV